MTEFLYGDQIIESIRNLVGNRKLQSEPLHVAVAYWGKNSIEETGLQKRIERNPTNVRVICDLLGGACNPNPIAKLQKLGSSVKTAPGMHAKVWICGDTVVVGSANVSANGLGFDDKNLTKGNHEAAVLINNSRFAKAVTSWFDGLWETESESVNNDHIRWAKDRWKFRKNSGERKRVSAKKSLLQRVRELKPSQRGFEKVKVLAYEIEDLPDPDGLENYLESDVAHEHFSPTEWEQKENRSYWMCLDENWEFENGDIHVAFSYPAGKRTNLEFVGIYRIISPTKTFKKIDDSYIVLCYQEHDCGGYILSRTDQKEIKQMIKLHNEEHDWETDDAGSLVDTGIREFVADFDTV